MEEERSGVCDLSSFINIHGHEDTTDLKRTEVLEEWQADVILLRRFRKIPLDQDSSHPFIVASWVTHYEFCKRALLSSLELHVLILIMSIWVSNSSSN